MPYHHYVCIFEDDEKPGNVCDRLATGLYMPNLIPVCDVHRPNGGTFIDLVLTDHIVLPVNEGEPTMPAGESVPVEPQPEPEPAPEPPPEPAPELA